jgi:CRP-like cAMP-binding protein
MLGSFRYMRVRDVAACSLSTKLAAGRLWMMCCTPSIRYASGPTELAAVSILAPTRETALEFRNRLLASLHWEDIALLRPHLREVAIEQGQFLEEPGRSVDAVYFPQSGMTSLIVQMPEDNAVEVGTVGSEGAIGMTVGLGSRISFICALVQVAGVALAIPASPFCAAVGQSARLRDLVVRYSELQLGQIQQTAACNALHDVASRLCRWLLQTSDRTGSDTIPFTHEFLGRMLGVRRATIFRFARSLPSAASSRRREE